MRRSVDNMDGTIWDVWLDGVLQENVVMADDETGEVERFKLDEHGAFRIAGDALETETVRGKVEIRPAGARITKLQGLVAPVWSDAGEAYSYEPLELCGGRLRDLGEPCVKQEVINGLQVLSITFPQATTDGVLIPTRRCEVMEDESGNVIAWREIEAPKPTDPNAKPALPALTRVSGNKRGPGWCSEE